MQTIKKILKILNVLAAFSVMIILMFGAWQTLPAAQTTSSVTDTWKISWVNLEGNIGAPNTMKLTETMGRISGTYKADDGSACPVDGTTSEGVSLLINCSQFSIKLEGKLGEDGTINGNYIYFVRTASTGTFKMEKITCWLPEGCKSARILPQYARDIWEFSFDRRRGL